jgi:hypothetical protein
LKTGRSHATKPEVTLFLNRDTRTVGEAAKNSALPARAIIDNVQEDRRNREGRWPRQGASPRHQ